MTKKVQNIEGNSSTEEGPGVKQWKIGDDEFH